MNPTPDIRILTVADLQKQGSDLRHCTLQGLGLTAVDGDWFRMTLDPTTTLLGCTLNEDQELHAIRQGAHVFREPEGLPYHPFRTGLYTWRELLEGYNDQKDQSRDLLIYEHFVKSRFNPPINEALWQRLHDHAIDDALRELLEFDNGGMTTERCVGFMGGHGIRRDAPFFSLSAKTAKLLAEADYFVVSGGGPGIMEAANLGAYMAGKPQEALNEAIELLAEAPHYTSPGYHEKAMMVIDRYPTGGDSLAIPTWFYGHEPSNLFASHIAKYFSNSLREDTLLAISLYGIVFAPGSAGTTQEIFMDATQNHYGTFNYYSPMVFLGTHRYQIDTLIYPLLKQLAHGRTYADLLHITDVPGEVVSFLQEHPPVPVATKTKLA